MWNCHFYNITQFADDVAVKYPEVCKDADPET